MLMNDSVAQTYGLWDCVPRRRRKAIAYLKGSPMYPQIRGIVIFTDVPGGTEVAVSVNGLPPYQPAPPGGDPIGPHGFHIHMFGNCLIGDPAMPFLGAGEHWNPDNQPHGNHAGDFPVLFPITAEAIMHFTDRFRVWKSSAVLFLFMKIPMITAQPGGFRAQDSLRCNPALSLPPLRGAKNGTKGKLSRSSVPFCAISVFSLILNCTIQPNFRISMLELNHRR